MQENFDFCSFAAANGYLGFKSYFREVFKPSILSRLYILKGGPGTGKSSYMKKIFSVFKEKGYHCEAILCSSDPDSYDGVIVESEGGSIAILDGTAPHTTDPTLPGAKEEIINLGDLWDSRFLKGRSEQIAALTLEKGQAYKSAYKYLETSGSAASIVTDDLKERFDFRKATRLAREIIPETDHSRVLKTRLFSAFGKSGLLRLDTPKYIAKKVYRVTGEARELFLTMLRDRAVNMSYGGIASPSPLDPSIADTLYLEESGILYSCYEDGEVIDTDALIRKKSVGADEKAKAIREEALYEAARRFKIAADLHARLETIYTASMDFGKWNESYERVLGECENILSGKQ